MKKQSLIIAISTILIGGLVACGGNQKADESSNNEDAEMSADHSEHGDHKDQSADGSSELLPVPEGAKVWFEGLQDGDAVTSPVKLTFMVDGMEVEPAGELHEGKGHHHLLIDRAFTDRGVVIPADSVNIHYGDGSTTAEIELTKGEHTLTMQFADGYHQSYGQQMSHSVRVFVE